MATFAPLEDQLDLITKGTAEIIPLEALKQRGTAYQIPSILGACGVVLRPR